jgi:Cysteine-rich secretory protein family/Bacterial Ig-like domain
MRRSLTAVLFLLIAVPALAEPAAESDVEAKALDRINFHREAAGLKPVTADPALSKGCVAHAQYLVKNADNPATQGLGMHKEDPKLPGYTDEGVKAAAAAVIYPTEDRVAAVDGWMATLFHRVPLLDPKLTKVGLGFAKGDKSGGFFMVDTIRGRDGKDSTKPVLYPADRQEDVPLKFIRELPDPLPAKAKAAGYPITATFPEKAAVKDVTASLKDGDDEEVAVWLSTPEKPAGDQKPFQRNTVCLIARAPLKPNTTYSVTIKAKVNEKAWSESWSFTTGKK